MGWELNVFKSFNCSLCESPYSKLPNDLKYPRRLLCEKVVCDECWKKEKPLKKEKRKHQCDLGSGCHITILDSRFPHFLLELLNDPSIIESPSGNGYLLSKAITNRLITNCPKCDVKYSMENSMENEQNKPVVLRCGHAICTSCYLTCRTVSSIPKKHNMNCPICSTTLYSCSSLMETRDNCFREFLRELPALINQIPQVLQSLALFGILGKNGASLKRRLIGRGGFGEVFQVIDHQPPIAIKYINCADETQIDRFQRECDALKKLKHKNIVTLLSSGRIEESTQFGIVMEFCERETLKKAILNPNLIYTMKTVIFWGKELFDALDYMFKEHKVLHRDIKPDNIFVDKDFRLKIGDFGFVKYIEQSCSGSFVGTQRYMSPPQFDGNEETIQDSHRNDVYSMGLVLWEIIERRIVLSDYNNKQGHFARDHFISALSRKEITKLSSPNCQPKLQAIVAQCVNFNRLLRPTASTVFAWLKEQKENRAFRLVHSIPIEDESQKEIVRPIFFDGTMRWITTETEQIQLF